MANRLLGLLLAVLVAVPAFADNGVPALLPFQGRVTDASGVPINYSVTINIRIFPPTGTCYIYEDTQVVTPNTYGLFSVVLGAAGNSTGPANTILDAFNNDIATALPTNCTGTNYTPAVGDWRRLLIVVDGTPLPDMQTIGSSAFAMNSQLLGGKSASGFIQVNGNVSQANMATLTGGSDASSLHTHDSLYSRLDGSNPFTGSVTTQSGIYAPSATGTVGIGTTSTTADLEIAKSAPSILLDATASGGGTSKIDFFSGTTQRGSIHVSEAANGMSFYSGTNLAMDFDTNGSATFYNSIKSLGTIGLAPYTTTQETAMLGNMNAANTGATWYNSSTGAIKIWNGTTAVPQAFLDTTGKLSNSWMPVSGVTAGSYGSATEVPTFTVGTDGRLTVAGTTTITGTLPGGAAGGDLTGTYPNPTIANNAVNTAKIANDSITSAKVNSTGVAVNRLLITDNSAGTTLKYSTCALGEMLMWTATGWTCTSMTTFLGASGVTSGTYGSSSATAVVTVDSNGRVTNAASTSIAFPVTSVAGHTGTVTLNAADVGGLGTASVHDVGLSAGNVVQLDGSAKIPSSLLPATAGTITEVDAGTALTGGGPSGVVTLNVDVGTTANKILQLTAGAQVPAVDGNLLTNINAVKLRGRDVASTAPASANVLMWNATTSVWEPQAAPVLAVAGRTGNVTLDYADIINAAGVYFNYKPNNVACTDGQLLSWNNTAVRWECATDQNAGGTITSLTTGNGLTGGSITTAGTLAVDTGTTANKIVQLNASAQIPAVDGALVTNINAVRIGTHTVATTLPTAGQFLGWNTTTTQWEPIATTVGTVTDVATGTGLLGGPFTVSGTLSVDVGTTASKIVQLTTGAQYPAVDGNLITNVNAVKLQTKNVSSTAPSNGQVLTFNTTTAQWEPANTNLTGSIAIVGAGTGLTGGPITSAGTLNVDVGTTASKIVQLTTGAQYPAVDGNLITNVNAVKLQTKNISSTAPSAGQVLTFNNTTAQWEPQNTNLTGSISSITTGNGLTGGTITTAGTITVDTGTTASKIVQLTTGAQYPAVDGNLITNTNAYNIRGKLVSTTAPTDAQALLYNSTTASWTPASLTGDIAVTAAGGVNVGAIQGKAVKSATPTANQVLTWNATTTQWEPQNTNYSGAVVSVATSTGLLGGPITSSGTLAVDVGTTASKIVQLTAGAQYPAVDGNLITNTNAYNIRGKLVSTTAPTDAQALLYNNTTSTWAPVTLSGDVTVTAAGAHTVTAIQGKSVKSGTPSAAQVLTWNGTSAQWDFQTPTVGTLTTVTTGTGLVGGTITSTGTISVDVGTTASKIVQLTTGSQYPAVDGNLITNLNAGSIGGVVPVASGGTNSSTALNSNRLMVSSGGKIVEAGAMTDGQIVVGKTSSAPQIVSPSGDVSTISTAGAFTVAKVNSVAYPASPGTGTLPSVTAANTVTYTAAPVLGVNATTAGSLGLANGSGGGLTTTVTGNATGSAYNFNLPSSAGASGAFLTSAGGGSSAMTWTTVIPVAAGGTGGGSGTQGGMPYYSGSTSMSSTAAGTSGQLLVSGGTGSPTWTSTPSVSTLSATGAISTNGGSMYAADSNVATGAAANFANGNVVVLQSVGGSTITVSGMNTGGAYTVIVADTAQRTYAFAGQCATSSFIPVNANTQSGKKSVYTIIYSTNVGGGTCLISWVSGF